MSVGVGQNCRDKKLEYSFFSYLVLSGKLGNNLQSSVHQKLSFLGLLSFRTRTKIPTTIWSRETISYFPEGLHTSHVFIILVNRGHNKEKRRRTQSYVVILSLSLTDSTQTTECVPSARVLDRYRHTKCVSTGIHVCAGNRLKGLIPLVHAVGVGLDWV
jgi:hypothetical protein